jgi:site-specific DNA-methyltransferase (adenine-specific)
MSAHLLKGDCRTALPAHGPFDLVIADPPYGDTSLPWDRKVDGWEAMALEVLKPSGSLWVFGSMRYFLTEGVPAGFRLAQDIVWEKHNGSGFHADRFKRVHEHVVQFYRHDAAWGGVYNKVQRSPRLGPSKAGALRRQLPHTGAIAPSRYADDGFRIQRSVVKCKSVRGGPHKTAKPVDLLEAIVRTSCPPGGLVADPFAGSGALGEVCIKTGRRYVGCEIDPAMASLAAMRISKAYWELRA